MNLIVAFDSSDWVGADLGEQTCPGRSRSHTAADALGRPDGWVAATTGISPAQPGQARSIGLVGGCWMRLTLISATRGRTSSFLKVVRMFRYTAPGIKRLPSSQARWG